MNYLSVCSGIEAATCAWHPLGWRPVAFSEIDAAPIKVLKHHYPDVPNFGDMNNFREWPDVKFDVLVGGTPCQSFSVAGLRKGLDDPRGNLMLTYLAIARRYRPKWVVWENVPGVLSINGGLDFAALLNGLAVLGYGFAYRILDAQYFRVAQRRRRVFVVGCLGDWRRAAAVLFERHSLSGNPAPRRQAGKVVTGTISARTQGGGGLGTDFECDGGIITMAHGQGNAEICIDQSPTLTCNHEAPIAGYVAHALRGEGFDASEDGTGRGTPLVPVAFDSRQDTISSTEVFGALGSSSPQAQAVALRGRAGGATAELGGDVQNALRASGGGGGGDKAHALVNMRVRRLTPLECDRLQGLPDNYTLVPDGKKMLADGPRYKAIGNSMAVPVMAWIGRRIALCDAIQ